MNWAYVHLSLNHFPVVGIVISVALLTIALVRREGGLEKASFIAFAVVAVVAIPVYFTGEPAEEIVEALPGMSEELIEAHEEAALIAFIALEALGGLGVAALLLLRRLGGLPRWFAPGLLALSLAAGAWTVWTANLGGRIRHTEARPEFGVSSTVGAGEAQWGSSRSMSRGFPRVEQTGQGRSKLRS